MSLQVGSFGSDELNPHSFESLSEQRPKVDVLARSPRELSYDPGATKTLVAGLCNLTNRM